MITQTYYISTGRKQAMYTLRMCRENSLVPVHPMVPVDFYICNLAATPELAEEKARAYFDAMAARITQSDGFQLRFAGYADFPIRERLGRLSAHDTACLRAIESGVFPFGKHRGASIADADSGYVLYWADQGAKLDNADNVVIQALSAACMGIALDKGYIATRQAKRDAQAVQDALSQHIGAIGGRLDITATLYACFPKYAFKGDTVPEYYINKLRVGDDIVVYMGKALGEVGATLAMRATVKAHSTYQGVNTTQVNRPTLL